jgi:hypothetical protein
MLTTADLKAGRKGFVTHDLCSHVFGGDHSDPMPNFPLAKYIEWANEFAADI